MNRMIRYASAPCGSAKTFQLVQRADRLTREGDNVLFLQPTKLLIDKTIADEFGRLADPPHVKVFHGDAVGTNVAYQLAEYFSNPEDRSHIVMATHAALPRIPFWSDASSWHLLIDEIPQVDREQAHIVPHTHTLITDHIQVGECTDGYGRIGIRYPKEIRRLARNPDEDELLERFRETATVLESEPWQSFVDVDQYHKLLDGAATTLNIHSVLMPSLVRRFASVFMVGANVCDTGLYALWSKLGINFVPDEEFLGKLRYRQHNNGPLTTIHYALDRNWSRYLLEKETDGKSNLERLRDAAKLVIGQRDFLWQANKTVPDKFFQGRGQRLPNNPLGLNEFDTVHDVVFLSALNPKPAHARFLEFLGLSPQEIERQGYCGVAYQAVMRTSLRDANDKNPKNIIVPDERLASYLAEMLPGATVCKMDTGISDEPARGGRPRKYQNNAEKMRRKREKEAGRRAELLAEVFTAQRSHAASDMHRTELAVSLYSGPVSRDQSLWASIFSNIRSTTPAAYLSCASAEYFVEAMRASHGRRIASGEEHLLFSPAIFDSELSEVGKRRRANIVYLQNIVLEFEGGDLQPVDVPDLFPDLQIIVSSNPGHTTGSPRFQVIILTERKIDPDTYEGLWDALANKLRDAGYTKAPRAGSKFKKSGLAHSKRTATSLFFLPVQATVDGFFYFYNGDQRRLLDVGHWNRKAKLDEIAGPATNGGDRTR